MSELKPISKRPRIMVVDDERILAETLSEFLTGEGFPVEVAFDARQAMIQLDHHKPEIVICDIQLPDKSGLELLEAMLKASPGLAVLMITAYATVESAIQAFHSGARDYLIKPILFDDLTARLDHLIEWQALKRENQALRRKLNQKVHARSGIESLVGTSPVMQSLKSWISRVGPTRANVLITGESGTGKELAARALHDQGDFPEAPFLAINCAAIPAELLENQLFGHVKGAFTGADRDRDGLFVAAADGTVFLDEIGELPIALQSKLLRVIENREVLPVGANRPSIMKARILSATNKNLDEEVKAGRFRADLYYRLNVVNVPMPSLRSRREDIPDIVEVLIQKHAQRMGKRIDSVDADAINRLMAMEWPGNVRELDNLLERAVILADGLHLTEAELFHFPGLIQDSVLDFKTGNGGSTEIQSSEWIDDLREAIREYEKAHLKRVLADSGDDRKRAAARLGLGLSSLYAKIKEHGLGGNY
ncbi:MAG: sigma-54-dependent Fis family transcriptional regulator [Planctomycetota bacterium]|nr:MAG: sigma-54-dependent Fis family transcriptional regulator [Planctomycetota bacterium]